jgi:hypothetical protein
VFRWTCVNTRSIVQILSVNTFSARCFSAAVSAVSYRCAIKALIIDKLEGSRAPDTSVIRTAYAVREIVTAAFTGSGVSDCVVDALCTECS